MREFILYDQVSLKSSFKRDRRLMVATIVAIVFSGYFLTLVAWNWVQAQPVRQRAGCCRQLNSIALQIESFRAKNGFFPRNLTKLHSRGDSIAQRCPNNPGQEYGYVCVGETFTLFCKGWNHRNRDTARDFPQYTSVRGLCFDEDRP